MKLNGNLEICPYPFGRLELNHKRFTPCCEHWTTEEFQKLSLQEPGWNGKAAQVLRQKLLQADYSFCKRDVCGTKFMTIDELKKRKGKYSPFNHISDKNMEALEEANTILPEGPAVIVISADQRCNLKCPSCRKQFITQLDPEQEKDILKTQQFIDANKPFIQSVRFNDGEPLFSPWTRSLIKSFSKDTFPRLKHVCLMTNGLLLNEKSVKELYEGFRFVDEVYVSIDAGDAEAYEKVRGGNWNQLMKNLEWVSENLLNQHLRIMDVAFVIQKNNYKSLPQFVKTMESFKVNEIIIRELHPWGAMELDYKESAVHRPEHPEHQDFREVLSSLPKTEKINLPPILSDLIY